MSKLTASSAYLFISRHCTLAVRGGHIVGVQGELSSVSVDMANVL